MVNYASLIGILGANPQPCTLSNGASAISLSLGIIENYIDKEGKKAQNIVWVNCLCESNWSVAAMRLKKDDHVWLQGNLRTEKWDEAETGTAYRVLEVDVTNMAKLDAKAIINETHNQVQLMGLLGDDPQIFTPPKGNKIARLSIAVKHTVRGSAEQETRWYQVTCWRSLADVASRFLKKGNRVYITGNIKCQQFRDSKGKPNYVVEVHADDLTLVDKYSPEQPSSLSKFRQPDGNGSNNDDPF